MLQFAVRVGPCGQVGVARSRLGQWLAALGLPALLAVLLMPNVALAGIEFKGPIPWKTMAAGQAEAKAKGKPMAVVVYGDWCPKCKLLAPVFGDAPVVEAAKGLVMIHQNQDRPGLPANLQRETYVPRIYFLYPDGTVASGITSDNPRYPNYYRPSRVDVLTAAMKRAAHELVAVAGKKRG